jgi:hypothetical protein
MDRQNKNLQKVLSNRNMVNQTRGNILSIYNSFYKGLSVVVAKNQYATTKKGGNHKLWLPPLKHLKIDKLNRNKLNSKVLS